MFFNKSVHCVKVTTSRHIVHKHNIGQLCLCAKERVHVLQAMWGHYMFTHIVGTRFPHGDQNTKINHARTVSPSTVELQPIY